MHPTQPSQQAAAQPGGYPQGFPPVAPRRPRWPWIVALAVVGLLVAAGGGVYLLGGFGGKSRVQTGRFARAPRACPLLRDAHLDLLVPHPRLTEGTSPRTVLQSQTHCDVWPEDEGPGSTALSFEVFAYHSPTGDNAARAGTFLRTAMSVYQNTAPVPELGDEAIQEIRLMVRIDNLVISVSPVDAGLLTRPGIRESMRAVAASAIAALPER